MKIENILIIIFSTLCGISLWWLLFKKKIRGIKAILAIIFLGLGSILAVLTLSPFIIGGLIIYFAYHKVYSPKLKYGIIIPVAFVSFVLGGSILYAVTTPTTSVGKTLGFGDLNSPVTHEENAPLADTSTLDTTAILTPSDEFQSALSKTPTITASNISSISSSETAGVTRTSVRVTRVIDGDTIEIEGGRRVRYIGINTPETVHPSKPVECYGKEASNKNKELVEGKIVELEKDISETDKDGRLLRYVWIGNLFVNEYLVREGYAQVSTYPPDVKYQDKFLEAQRKAKQGNKGLWSVYCNNWSSTTGFNSESGSNQKSTDLLSINNGYICNCSKLCNKMSSCEEAYFQLNNCGCSKRDGDSDGIPCEDICGGGATYSEVKQSQQTQSAQQSTSQKQSSSVEYTCNCSKTCPQMSSCDEAYYQLNQCGCLKRDGDKDGIPCEELCLGG